MFRIASKLQARGYWAESPADDGSGANTGGSAVDQITDLLMGGTEEPTPEKKQKDEAEADDTQPEDSNLDEETDGEEDESEETEEPEEGSDEDDSDLTWGKTLGIDDKHVELDEEGNFVGIKTVVNGKAETIGVKDLVAGYQTAKSNTYKSQQLAEERKEFEGLKVAVATEYTKKIEVVENLTNHMKNSLLSDYQGVDWNKLRAENPGEYAAAIQDFNIRSAEIDRIANAVQAEKQGLTQEQILEQQTQTQAYIKAQAEKVLENNPAWTKPEEFKKALTEMTSFVNEAYGFSEQEFATVQDARLIELVKDAMKYRQSVKTAKTKLDTKVPSFQKSKGKSTKTVSKLNKLVNKAKTTTGHAHRAAATDAVTALLLGIE